MKEHKNELMWSHIYWLTMLSTTGSYTATAKRLGVSKAAVSLRIAELEQFAGVALVRRTTRSVRLTEPGEALVKNTRHSFDAIEQGFASIKDLADVPSGVVRITAPVALGRQKIIPLINAFLQDYPDIRLEIELSDHLSSLTQEGFDLAIRHTTNVPETHVAWLLRPSRTLLVATPAYLKKQGMPKKPEDLSGHNCLYYLRAATSPTWLFESGQRKKERRSVAIRGNFCANNSEALREIVLAGQGIALLPDFSALQDLAARRLTHLLPDWKPVGVFGDAIYAIRPYSAYVPRAVRVFVDYLKSAFAKM
ncbi:LysR family transcriptional regulator [Paralcaligenes sp. KSB-10]|uniref:LysR family transcriptional regulator n=1 Tax=Paralcaligenes sp. KSB-10 TaxID=2901142 RepID=UPI001E2A962E|nr:LysR family transcriptional regulator [Paralcaligenes sp. KSB-10]UHL65744.1 LysR family transcriptional regulator [Paralcaligenes sp. KSB-10]